MRDFETAFIANMRVHVEEGMNFAQVAQETLADTMGETPSQVLFKIIGKAGFTRPELLVEGISHFFEGGARDVLAAIESRALRWKELVPYDHPASAYESLMETLILVKEVRTSSSRAVLLHNHRIKDQLETYAEDA